MNKNNFKGKFDADTILSTTKLEPVLTAAYSCTAVTTGIVSRPLVSPWNDANRYLVGLAVVEVASAVITKRSPFD